MIHPFRLLLLGVLTLPYSTAALAADDDVSAGAREFAVSCAVCHGVSGQGDGEVAKVLTVKPADLTQLAKKNNGQFPFRQVFQTIDGRAVVKSHGSSAMPVWGDRYVAQSGGDAVEPYRSWTAAPFVRARILELTYYIQSIQK